MLIHAAGPHGSSRRVTLLAWYGEICVGSGSSPASNRRWLSHDQVTWAVAGSHCSTATPYHEAPWPSDSTDVVSDRISPLGSTWEWWLKPRPNAGSVRSSRTLPDRSTWRTTPRLGWLASNSPHPPPRWTTPSPM